MKCANPKCGKEFEPFRDKKCCSKECNSFFQKNKKRILSGTFQAIYSRDCSCCGTHFETHILKKVFCSKRCKQTILRRKWVKNNPDKIRLIKFKKNELSRQKTIKRQLEYTPTPGICKVCGNSFIMKIQNPYQIFCSVKCRKRDEYIKYGWKQREKSKARSLFRNMTDEEKTKVCYCGKHFKIKISRPGQIYCSIKCQRLILGPRFKEKHPDRIRINANKYARKSIELLFDGYVKNQLFKTIGTRAVEIPQPLVELKRNHIKLKRKLYGKSRNNTSEPVRTGS